MMIFYIIYLHLYYSCTVGRGLARYKRTPYISICFHKMIYILYLYHSHIILVLIILFFNNQIVTFKIVTFVLPQMTSNELSMPSSSFNQCVIVFSCTHLEWDKNLGVVLQFDTRSTCSRGSGAPLSYHANYHADTNVKGRGLTQLTEGRQWEGGPNLTEPVRKYYQSFYHIQFVIIYMC